MSCWPSAPDSRTTPRGFGSCNFPSSYGVLRQIQTAVMDETFGVDLQTPDFVKVAEGMGLAAEAVGTVGDVDVEDRWSVSPEDLDSLEEPLEILSDQTVLKELVDAEAAVAAGDVVRGVEAVRALRRPAG